MEDLPFLSIASAKINEIAGEVEAIIWHEKHKLSLFAVEMTFVDKRDGKWIGQVYFLVPDDIYLNTMLKRKLKFYLIEIFGSIFDEHLTEEHLTMVDPLAALEEEIERDLAHMSM